MNLPMLLALLGTIVSSDSVSINNMRSSAGTLRGTTLSVQLEAREGAWYPDGQKGQPRTVAAFGEVGKQLQNPGPLIRVKRGTEVRVTLHNKLKDPMCLACGSSIARLLFKSCMVAMWPAK